MTCPADKVSGLKDAVRILDGVEDIAICRLTASDVVRHVLVQRIIAAYEKASQPAAKPNPAPGRRYPPEMKHTYHHRIPRGGAAGGLCTPAPLHPHGAGRGGRARPL